MRRDRWGIAHVCARNEGDLWFGLGFCQGQDHSFAISLSIRAAQGRLSEMVGVAGLGADSMARHLGLDLECEAALQSMPAALRERLTSFAKGLNAGCSVGRRKRAPAFVLARAHPIEFSAGALIPLLRLHAMASDRSLRELVDEGGGEPRAREERRKQLRALLAWAPLHRAEIEQVPAADTAAGGGILAASLHAPAHLPCPFYLCHLQGSEWEAAGAAPLGLPMLLAGHDASAAWCLAHFSAPAWRGLSQEEADAAVIRNVGVFVRDAAPRTLKCAHVGGQPALLWEGGGCVRVTREGQTRASRSLPDLSAFDLHRVHTAGEAKVPGENCVAVISRGEAATREGGLTVADCMRGQSQAPHPDWKVQRAEILGSLAEGEFDALRPMLAAWDGRLRADSCAAAVFATWMAADADASAHARMRACLESLRAKLGPEPKRWCWGELEPLRLQHPLSALVPASAPLFDLGPFAWGGPLPERGERVVPVLRMVVDLGAPHQSRYCMLGGQSGNPMSGHYDTFVDLWLRGQGVPIELGAGAAERVSAQELEIRPLKR